MVRPQVHLPRSDIEEESHEREQQQNAAAFALDQIGVILFEADSALAELEQSDMLKTAILRGCNDLADGIGHLADHMDHQTDEERRALAQACINDPLLLQSEQLSADQYQHDTVSEDQLVQVIQASGSLLRDVEVTLRAIDKDEAEELADVALTVAQMFIASLQSIHATLTPEHLALGDGQQLSQSNRNAGLVIELLDDEEDSNDRSKTGTNQTPLLSNTQPTSSKNQKRRKDRLRVLWPALGPSVVSACRWGKDAAAQKPLIAVALGMTLWPAALCTVFVGAPLIFLDGFIQKTYENSSDAAWVGGLERTAAQLYQSAKLSFICSKLVARQTLRVMSRQVKRHGGVGRIMQNVGDMAVERCMHPIDTISMVWKGVLWGFGAVCDTWSQVTEAILENNETVQRLQQ
jgi:hypothetical protein